MTSLFLPASKTLSLFTIKEIRQIEISAKALLATDSLMYAAGRAAASMVKTLVPVSNSKILILAGPGDNGGDALEAAHLLATSGYTVKIILCADTDRYSGEAQHSLHRAQASKVELIKLGQFLEADDERCSLVLDGLFGIGLARAITGELASLVDRVNRLTQQYQCPVLALDVPSGLNADTGQVIGKAGVAIRASHTITFIGNKPGLHTATGKDLAGHITVAEDRKSVV